MDFNELPPAKGKGQSISQTLEGQIVVVQAAGLMQTRKAIPESNPGLRHMVHGPDNARVQDASIHLTAAP